MLHAFYHLFMACCMFVLSFGFLLVALAMWKKSNSLCDVCRKELKND